MGIIVPPIQVLEIVLLPIEEVVERRPDQVTQVIAVLVLQELTVEW